LSIEDLDCRVTIAIAECRLELPSAGSNSHQWAIDNEIGNRQSSMKSAIANPNHQSALVNS
jgi:hypothetical protein